MKRYKLLNNVLGWVVFVIAAVTYILTLESTASFWDCGEFIASGYKLEVGHPPGNPIFMLTARFFANFASSPSEVAYMVNLMSGLLSAATILLLFWTITRLAQKIVLREEETEETMSLGQMIAILGCGLVGALAYAWSDTFWFSAVEGEVYAYSSFCTALVFWLILKWESVADLPHANRYIILIAYIIGVSIAVHLLNLLCIPAIVLVYYYRKYKNTDLKGSLIALLVSFVLIVLLLYDRSLLRIHLRDLPFFLSAAVNGYLLMNVCYNTSVGILTLTLASVLLCLCPIFVLLLGAVFFHEKITPVKVSCMLAAVVGCALISGVFDSHSELVWSSVGILTGLGSAFFNAIYTINSKQLTERNYHALTINIYVFAITTLILTPFADWNAIGAFVSAAPLKGSAFYFAQALVTSILPNFFTRFPSNISIPATRRFFPAARNRPPLCS